MSYWAVAQIEVQRERIATLLLNRAGYEIYAPRIQLSRQRRKRAVLLFPSYIFVRIVDRFYPVKNTPGVLRLLMDGERPARMPDSALDQLRGKEVRGFIRLPKKQPAHGQRMRIINGPFAGHLALFEGMTGHERQKVLIAFLSGAVTIELPVRDAIPLDVAS